MTMMEVTNGDATILQQPQSGPAVLCSMLGPLVAPDAQEYLPGDWCLTSISQSGSNMPHCIPGLKHSKSHDKRSFSGGPHPRHMVL